MRVIGIDPGYDRLGVAIIERDQNGKEQLLYSTCIETDRSLSLPHRHKAAGDALCHILATYTPEVLGIETLFFNKNVKTALGVAEARGIALYVAQKAGCQVIEVSPQQVKVAITGYGKSDKVSVKTMLHKLVGNLPETALDDEYDAIAVGMTALAHHR
jgi:crossover junction endodeoxyribonuclease RuvC